MALYNGHRSWNAWNVALWISNEGPLYRLAIESIDKVHKRWPDALPDRIANSATSYFLRWAVCLGDRTPDGAVYNRLSIKLAILGLME